jgi:N-acetylmuramoyl-L-alanine amidase
MRTRFILGTFLTSLSLLASGMAQAAGRELSGMRLWAQSQYTRAVFDVAGPVEYQLQTLSNPDRIVIDIDRTKLRGDVDPMVEGIGVLRAVRIGDGKSNRVRVVFDLREAVTPKSFHLTPGENAGHRLVVDLYPKTKIASVQPAIQQLRRQPQRWCAAIPWRTPTSAAIS